MISSAMSFHRAESYTRRRCTGNTQRDVTLNVCEVHQWKDGELNRLVNYTDAMSLMVQVGAFPAQTGS